MSADGGAAAVPAAVMQAWFEAMPDPQVLLESVRDGHGGVVDFVYRDLNPAACAQLRLPRRDVRGRSVSRILPGFVASGLLAAYTRCLETAEPLALDDQPLTLLDEPHRYDIRGNRVARDLLAVSWRDVTDRFGLTQELESARRGQAAADALYRRSMDSAAVGMGLVSVDGRFLEVNEAMCAFFGYDAATLIGTRWQDLTADRDLAAGISGVREILSGRADSYRATKGYIHADGSLIWGVLSVGCVRADDGRVEILIAQIVDITEEVGAREQLAAERARSEALAQRLTSEIRSAASYVISTLPADMSGPVELSSRYLPSLDLGGDCFNYIWLDADHLAIYLIDISGHGVRPALLSMSVHNLMRSGSLPIKVLLKPERVMARLNLMFRMDSHDGNYFTIWYGVYEVSSRTLRYASAGHPPALAFVPAGGHDWHCVVLSTDCLPVGMFDDTAFRSDSYSVPAGCRLLVFSDGAVELALSDGRQSTLRDFTDLTMQLMKSGEFSLETLVGTLRSRSNDGHFDDDCSVILAEFP